jgi:NADH-quinone oxidoreductase subunit A
VIHLDEGALTLAVILSVGVVVGLLGYVISRLITPRKEYPLKFERFEAGNLPQGRARGFFVMQYYAYLIIFLTVEPIAIFFFIIMVNIVSSPFSIILFFILLLSLIPPLIFGLNEARKVTVWALRKEKYS